jgi:lipopolysaccharide/colanic/teichoic acid biosynthesis glycosyltransferase
MYHNPRFVVFALRQLLRDHSLGRQPCRSPAPVKLQPGEVAPATTVVDVAGIERLLSSKGIQLRLKRFFDIVAASLVLIALAPLFLLTAVLIRCTSRGPVLFRQSRLGYGGKEFTIYKFRSMRDADDPALARAQAAAAARGILLKGASDPRITPLGRVLRATSLDELPQLNNVIKGEMSIVGPRPLVPFMLAPYPELARARGLMRPGMTGLWQVRDRQNNTNALAMAPHDLEYVCRFNLATDFVIVLKTVRVLLSRKGAC